MPITRPPMTAPGMLSSPPRMTAGKTLRPKSEKVMFTPLMLPMSTPPIAETTAEMAQESAKIALTEMPIESATWCELAVARIATPSRVNLKKSAKATISAIAVQKVQM